MYIKFHILVNVLNFTEIHNASYFPYYGKKLLYLRIQGFWRWSMRRCTTIVSFLVKNLKQMGHWKCRCLPHSNFMWRVKWPFCVYFFPHLHANWRLSTLGFTYTLYLELHTATNNKYNNYERKTWSTKLTINR